MAISPCSEEKFWSALRSRVEILLERRKRPADWSSSSSCGEESRIGKRIRDDSLLLIRGLDSVASSLSHLKETLDDASQLSQGLENVAHSSLADLPGGERKGTKEENADSDDSSGNRTSAGEEICEAVAEVEEQKIKDEQIVEGAKKGTLKKAKNLAICVLSKATSLARELKTAESKLVFVQERCEMLEEENRRLRIGNERDPTEEEDDLVRLQVEALLTEKSRLANENANLTRENQRLKQLVEYHQLNAQDLADTYGDFIHGVCLDFSDLEEEVES
ncbi:GRIP/coiled-coil protein [Wolffia australiana]